MVYIIDIIGYVCVAYNIYGLHALNLVQVKKAMTRNLQHTYTNSPATVRGKWKETWNNGRHSALQERRHVKALLTSNFDSVTEISQREDKLPVKSIIATDSH